MSELIVVAYPDRHRADEVLLELRKSERAHLVDLEDAAVVSKSPSGRVSLRQTQHLSASGALGGGFWGLLIGALFMAPVLGAAVGAATGALAGALADVGIDDDFMQQLAETLEPDSSALFLLVIRAAPGKIVADLAPFGGTVLRTTLAHVDEQALREALAGAGQNQL
ncbi:MAG: DUF1269 domain-containing protein [Enhygromyxa sp.]